MDLGSLFLIFGVAIFVFFIVSKPLFEISAEKRLVAKSQVVIENSQQRSILLAERDRVLRSLQELDFDYSLGKIPQEDYPEQRNFLLRKGADLIRSLDEMAGQSTEEDAVRRVEAVIEANRAAGMTPEMPETESDDISVLIAARKRAKLEKPTGFCPKCGKPVTATDKFCAKCGKVLK
jgi:NADH pyrophosphatase NudC (nudix superfamily)